MLCLAIFLLVLAGCSSYEPRLNAGQKAAAGRKLLEISKDRLNNANALATAIANVKDPQTARAAIPEVTKLYGVWKDLIIEEKIARKTSTPEEDKRAQVDFGQRITSAEDGVSQAITNMPVHPVPPELTQALDDGKKGVEDANNTTVAAGELVAKQAEGGAWMMWVLELFILAACAGFLFRDGICSNFIRLVNVLFAGLLAMNYFEPLAKLMIGYSEDVQTFTAFMDFLAFWICFAGSAAILIAVTDQVSRVRVRFLQVVDRAGGAVLSLCIGWVMCGIVLTSLHTAPLGEYPFLGCFQPQASMFLGMLAPDREWLGFVKYQSGGTDLGSGPVCRAVSSSDLKKVAFTDSPKNFIDEHHKRRIAIENYVRGNTEHAIRVNKQFIKPPAPPPKPGG